MIGETLHTQVSKRVVVAGKGQDDVHEPACVATKFRERAALKVAGHGVVHVFAHSIQAIYPGMICGPESTLQVRSV